MNAVKVFSPATVANVTCAFDILGFSLQSPGDVVVLKKTKTKKITISKIEGDGNRLPYDPQKNTSAIAITSCLKAHNITNIGLDVELYKQMPIGSGLGSSAASSVAGVFAINQLLELGLTNEEMLPHAMQGELVACGSAHADNVAPALRGGLVLIRSYDPLDVTNIPYPSRIYATVVFPHIELKTQDARNVLKTRVKLPIAVKQWGNIAGLIAGFTTNNTLLIKNSMHDAIIEPMRSVLIPGYDKAKEKALEKGALGFGISGSGPSVFALSENEKTANNIAEVVKNSFKKIQIPSDSYISPIGAGKPLVLDTY